MSHAARVLEECAAAPDDDGPRLVWADLVGGERGELVVLQCDLARGGLTSREVAQRRAREKQLLETNTIEWAGELATIASRWKFRRGFIETARIELRNFDAKKLAAHPLLRSVSVEAWNGPLDHLDELMRTIALRGFGLVGGHQHTDRGPLLHSIDLAKLHGLAAFGIDHAEVRNFAVLQTIVGNAPIEQLWLHAHVLELEHVEALLQAAPRVSALELTSASHEPPAAGLLRRPLRALAATLTWRELDVLADSSGETLERLALVVQGDVARAIDVIGSFRRLRTLDIEGNEPEIVAKQLVRSQRFESLRDLRISGATSVPLRPVIARFGPQLERFHLPYAVDIDTSAVAGEVYIPEFVAYQRPLLHHDAATMLALGPPSFPRMAPACIARLDIQGPIWDLPALPAEDAIFFGRSMDATVRLNSAMVARRHARLVWRDNHHVLEDLHSANGVYIEDTRIEQRTLVDGVEFRIADVLLQYFVGNGARQRADEAVAAANTIDPNTRLYRHDAPAARLRVRDWDAVTSRYGRSLADYIMRTLAQEIERELPNEKLWLVHHGCFGLDSRAVAERVAHPRRIDLGYTSIDVELEVP